MGWTEITDTLWNAIDDDRIVVDNYLYQLKLANEDAKTQLHKTQTQYNLLWHNANQYLQTGLNDLSDEVTSRINSITGLSQDWVLAQIDLLRIELNAEIVSSNQDLTDYVNLSVATLNDQIDLNTTTLNTRIDTVEADLTQQITNAETTLNTDIDDLWDWITYEYSTDIAQINQGILDNTDLINTTAQDTMTYIDSGLITVQDVLTQSINENVASLSQLITDSISPLGREVRDIKAEIIRDLIQVYDAIQISVQNILEIVNEKVDEVMAQIANPEVLLAWVFNIEPEKWTLINDNIKQILIKALE